MSVRSATLPSSALHRDCPVFIRLQHGQHRVGASQVSCLHTLVMASCFCHLQKLFTCPEVEECTWAAHGPHTCSRASELPWEATVRKAKNKCEAKVTAAPTGRGSWGSRGGAGGGGSPLEWVLRERTQAWLELATSLCAGSPPHPYPIVLGQWGHGCAHSPAKGTEAPGNQCLRQQTRQLSEPHLHLFLKVRAAESHAHLFVCVPACGMVTCV